jgi:dCMP deaminase
MNRQEKIDSIMIQTAELWSQMSKCKRKKVGAVIAKDERIISIGYNGLPSGYEPDVCEKIERKIICNHCHKEINEFMVENDQIFCPVCNVKIGSVEKIGEGIEKYTGDFDVKENTITNSNVIHAEANAILFCARNGIPTKNCTLYVTMSPCIECTKMIIQAGIKRVVYKEDYRNSDGIELLKNTGIEVIKIK